MLGTLVEAAALHGVHVEGVAVGLAAETATKPQRIRSIEVELQLPAGLPPAKLDLLTRSASRCKIHNTLREPPTITMQSLATGTAVGRHS